MPRVSTKKKNKAGKPYGCCRCDKKIRAGEQYYEWSFRYGGTYRQHAEHGHPKQSQLTQSKMSDVYAAVEDATDTISGADNVADIAGALNDCAETVGNTRDEYQDAYDQIPNPDVEEKISSLESFVDELQNAASDIEGQESDFDQEEPSLDDPNHGEWETLRDEAESNMVDAARQQAQDALDTLEV